MVLSPVTFRIVHNQRWIFMIPMHYLAHGSHISFRQNMETCGASTLPTPAFAVRGWETYSLLDLSSEAPGVEQFGVWGRWIIFDWFPTSLRIRKRKRQMTSGEVWMALWDEHSVPSDAMLGVVVWLAGHSSCLQTVMCNWNLPSDIEALRPLVPQHHHSSLDSSTWASSHLSLTVWV